jgi:16S rRNA (cytosine1402-N4)-methyltransferase
MRGSDGHEAPAPEPVDPSSMGRQPHRRRARYPGKNPCRFADKYKELEPADHPETIHKLLAAGKTPAGTHRPIMVAEILLALNPQAGETAVDCTLGYGGHARAILPLLQPAGRLIGLDVDPIELPKTEARLQALGLGSGTFRAHRSNFAGLPKILATEGLGGVDLILADLGVSSMQIDDPARGFSVKREGPLDMRMNPQRGQSASDLIQGISPEKLARLLADHSDEPHARALATALAGCRFDTTLSLGNAVRQALPQSVAEADRVKSIRRLFQALRIAVNEELVALDQFLRVLPDCLNSGGRVAILTFHSGEDRRVKKAFEAGLRNGAYRVVADDPIRPNASEIFNNPRSSSAKLRWAIRS